MIDPVDNHEALAGPNTHNMGELSLGLGVIAGSQVETTQIGGNRSVLTHEYLDNLVDEMQPLLGVRQRAYLRLIDRARQMREAVYGANELLTNSTILSSPELNGFHQTLDQRKLRRSRDRFKDEHGNGVVLSMLAEVRFRARRMRESEPLTHESQDLFSLSFDDTNPEAGDSHDPDYNASLAIDVVDAAVISKFESFFTTVENIDVFLDWVKDRSGNRGDGSALTIFQILATDLVDINYEGRLFSSIERMVSPLNPEIKRKFLVDLINGKDGQDFKEWANLFTGDLETAIELAVNKFNDWPKNLKEKFERFMLSLKHSTFSKVTDGLSRFYRKMYQEPKFERTWDNYRNNIQNGRGETPKTNGSAKTKKSHSRVTPKTRTSVAEKDIEMAENTLYLAKIVGSTIHWGDDAQELVEGGDLYSQIANFARDHNSAELEADIIKMVDHVRHLPFDDPGSLMKYIKVDGCRLRRTRPNNMRGFATTTKLTRDVRVVYVTKTNVDGSTDVGIVGIFRHDDYIRYYKNLIK